MKKAALFIVSLVLCVGLDSVDAQTVGECTDQMTASLMKAVPTCDAILNFAKCVLRGTGLYKTMTTDDDVEQFKIGFEQGLAKGGLYCPTNFKRVVEELREEERVGGTNPTSPPKEYKDAKTIGDCIDKLMAESTATSGLSCSHVTPYTKCVIRVVNAHNLASLLSDQDYWTMEQSIKKELSKLGIYCDINVRAIFEDIRREESGANQFDVSTRPFFHGHKSAEYAVDVTTRSYVPYVLGQERRGNGSDVISRPFQLVTLLIFTAMSMLDVR